MGWVRAVNALIWSQIAIKRWQLILGYHSVYLFWKVEQVPIMQKLAEVDIWGEPVKCVKMSDPNIN